MLRRLAGAARGSRRRSSRTPALGRRPPRSPRFPRRAFSWWTRNGPSGAAQSPARTGRGGCPGGSSPRRRAPAGPLESCSSRRHGPETEAREEAPCSGPSSLGQTVSSPSPPGGPRALSSPRESWRLGRETRPPPRRRRRSSLREPAPTRPRRSPPPRPDGPRGGATSVLLALYRRRARGAWPRRRGTLGAFPSLAGALGAPFPRRDAHGTHDGVARGRGPELRSMA